MCQGAPFLSNIQEKNSKTKKNLLDIQKFFVSLLSCPVLGQYTRLFFKNKITNFCLAVSADDAEVVDVLLF